jgi:hypothetical protein
MNNYAPTTPLHTLTQEQLQEISKNIYRSNNVKVGINNNVIDSGEYNDIKNSLEFQTKNCIDAIKTLTVAAKDFQELKKCTAVVDYDNPETVVKTKPNLHEEIHMQLAILAKTLEGCGIGISDVFKNEGV